MTYRSAVNKSPGVTPSNIIFGRQLRLSDLLFERAGNYERALEDHLVWIHGLFGKNKKSSITTCKIDTYDVSSNNRNFQNDIKVIVLQPGPAN